MITEHQAKYFAHELTRRFSVSNSEKLAATLLDAQVDLNPHQVEAALFAFKSPLSKGAVLADEVGLGKTIEAGLVLSQKWTEGKRRILVVTPANLRKQWAQEMQDKFFLPAVILESKNHSEFKRAGVRRPFEQDALVVCSFQFAAKRKEELMVIPWDLVVIDEAHRLRNVYKPGNKIGRALKDAFANVPKILLTATPLQNSLMELYGLVSIIDDYAFGDAKSFRAKYSRLDGEDLFDELKARLNPICQRTLRRQVLEYIRFTNRIPLTQEFVPTEKEQTLYDRVSEYLRRPNLQALPSSQRTLIILVMRKLLASSTFAIAGALDSLAKKLEKQLKADGRDQSIEEDISKDYEEYEEVAEEWEEAEANEEKPLDISAMRAEIAELHEFRDLAISITENAKGQALLSALSAGFAKARELGSAEKAIIFTESRRTQDYLMRILSNAGYEGKLVLFNGSNSDPNAANIYKRWLSINRNSDRVSGSRSADMRAALVDHFKDQAQIMIATEAASEGINLQFCSMVVNYDLPWNPQRIEQRIGRCHRYGQMHDVVVINFLNKNNAADQRVYELLDEKFKLFSGVFGASDEVLGVIESGVDFEKRIVDIYQNCRTTEEIEAEFTRLREEMDSQISATMEDTRRKLLENFDADVHERLRINRSESNEYLTKYETLLWELTCFVLGDAAKFEPDHYAFGLNRVPGGLSIPAGRYQIGSDDGHAHRYRLRHPLAQYVVQQAANKELSCANIEFDYSGWGQKAVRVEPLVGTQGVLEVEKLSISGADAQDYLLFSGLTDKGIELTVEQAQRLLRLPARITGPAADIDGARCKRTLEAQKSEILREISERNAAWFDDEMEKLDKWADDKRTTLKVNLREMDEEIKIIKKQIRSSGSLPEKVELQRKAKQLEVKRDEAWREYDQGARDVEREKDALLDHVEDRLKQETSVERLFTIRWSLK